MARSWWYRGVFCQISFPGLDTRLVGRGIGRLRNVVCLFGDVVQEASLHWRQSDPYSGSLASGLGCRFGFWPFQDALLRRLSVCAAPLRSPIGPRILRWDLVVG